MCAGQGSASRWRARARRFLLLLGAIAFLLLLHPLLGSLNLVAARLLLSAFLAGVLLSGVYAVSDRRWTLTAALLLAVPGLLASLSLEFSRAPEILFARQAFLALFFALVSWIILAHVFRPGAVTSDKLYGALCVYLLLGLLWASLYSMLHQLQPPAFPGEFHPHHQYLYYSLVTLTTLGYGDFTPRTPLAQSLSTLQAVTGQIYLAVLVARLVGLHILHSRDGD